MSRGRLIIWGAGGHGRVVADVAEASGWEIVAFVAQGEGGTTRRGGKELPLVTDAALRAGLAAGAALPFEATAIALGVGDNAARLAMAELVPEPLLPALVHPSAIVSPSASFRAGTVLLPLVVVNARATVGRGVILNTGCVVEHDCRVDDGAHLSPGAIIAGGVTVERLAWVGTGAVVIPGRTVGAGAIVGAGSTAHRDVPPGATVVGNPARLVPGK